MNTRLKREYPCTDSVMLSSSDVIRGIFEDYFSDFYTFDALEFTEEFGPTLTDKINAGFSVERDTLVVDQVSKESADVSESIDIMLERYDTLIYYVDKQFGDEPEIHKQFCTACISQIKRSNGKLLLLMEEVYNAIQNNNATLEEGGYTVEKLQEFITAKESFRKHYIEQQDALKRRPVKTAERLKLFNTIWQQIIQIHEAAKRIYRNQPEILALFDLPKGHTSTPTEPPQIN